MSDLETVSNSNGWSFMPSDWRLLLSAFTGAQGIGLLSLISLPFLIGSTMQSLGLDEAKAGALASIEFVAVVIVSLSLAPYMGKVNRRRIALIGAAIAVVTNVACVFTDSYSVICVLRGLAGVGIGMVLTTGNAAVSNADDTERFASHMSILFVLLMLGVMLSFPSLSEQWGHKGVYGGLAAVITVLSGFLLWLPKEPNKQQEEVGKNHNVNTVYSVAGMLVLLAFFMFSMRDTMAWAFVETIGSEIGRAPAEIGSLFATMSVLGLIGPIAAMLLGSRLGLVLPLSIGIICSGLVTILVSQALSFPQFYDVAVLLWAVFYFFTLAYLTALAASLDSEGRIVAATGSAIMGGLAIAPAVAGELITGGGYDLVGISKAVFVLITLLAALGAIYIYSKNKSTVAASANT